MTDADLRALRDRGEIERVLYLYAEMVEQQRWPLMDQVFALEATVDFRPGGGIQGPFRETLAWVARALEPWPTHLHHVTNVRIDFEGEDEARCRCHFHDQLARQRSDDSQLVLTTAGICCDRLVRTHDGWRILERHLEPPLLQSALPDGYHIPA